MITVFGSMFFPDGSSFPFLSLMSSVSASQPRRIGVQFPLALQRIGPNNAATDSLIKVT